MMKLKLPAIPGLPRLRRGEPASSYPVDFGLLPADKRGRVALVTMLEVDTDRFDEIIAATQSTLRRYDKIVYLTDALDFTPFRQRRLVFEYWPSPREIDRHGAGLDWARYLSAKRDLLFMKWSVTVVVAYGRTIEDRISSMLRSATGVDGSTA
jgi:hypothetical protein